MRPESGEVWSAASLEPSRTGSMTCHVRLCSLASANYSVVKLLILEKMRFQELPAHGSEQIVGHPETDHNWLQGN